MKIERSATPGLVYFEPRKIQDERGYFAEIFRQDCFRDHAGRHDLVQENQSLSKAVGTIRGLHFQTHPFAQGKLIRVLAGRIFDVVVDLRQGSPAFGRATCFDLSADVGNQLWVPPGFAHGFCTMQPDSVVCYKVTAYYDAGHDAGLAWDDPDIGIEWPGCADPRTLSGKDRALPGIRTLPPHFVYGEA